MPQVVRPTTPLTGYLYFSDDGRRAELVDARGRFTDTLPSTAGLQARQVALVSFSGGTFEMVGLMTRGAKVANYKWRVTFEDFVEFDPPLSLQELQERLSPRVSAMVATAQRAPGAQLDQRAWSECRQAILDLYPDTDLASLEARASARRPRNPTDDREPIVAYEYDA